MASTTPDVMLRQATRRNASAIAAGRVSLGRASVDQLPPWLGGPFDAILTVNSVGFWPAPAERLDELRRRLRAGGHIAVAAQPRCPGATASTSRTAARNIEALLQNAGYVQIRTATLDLDPPVVCILAINPIGTGSSRHVRADGPGGSMDRCADGRLGRASSGNDRTVAHSKDST